jgi:hypothetical protein
VREMVGRALLVALLAVAVAQIGAAPASGGPEIRPPVHYLARADARLCPSPMCGGLWLKAVNGARAPCASPVGGQCYVTGLDFRSFDLDEARQAKFTEQVANGGWLVTGYLTPADFEGFPELRALRVAGLRRPASARKASGAFRLLQDNGVRCVTHPCFSTRSTTLNTGKTVDVSEVDWSGTGASAAERRRADTLIATRQLVVSGVVERSPDGGRVVAASQIYFMVRLG